MHIYIYIYVHTYTNICMYVYTYIYMFINLNMYTHTCIYTYLHDVYSYMSIPLCLFTAARPRCRFVKWQISAFLHIQTGLRVSKGTHCNTLQHTATHCCTLHRTATYRAETHTHISDWTNLHFSHYLSVCIMSSCANARVLVRVCLCVCICVCVRRFRVCTCMCVCWMSLILN